MGSLSEDVQEQAEPKLRVLPSLPSGEPPHEAGVAARLWRDSIDLAHSSLTDPFVVQLRDGTLPRCAAGHGVHPRCPPHRLRPAIPQGFCAASCFCCRGLAQAAACTQCKPSFHQPASQHPPGPTAQEHLPSVHQSRHPLPSCLRRRVQSLDGTLRAGARPRGAPAGSGARESGGGD